MRLLGFYWGIFGVIAILLFAIIRLSSKIVEMTAHPLSWVHWTCLVGFSLYMLYAEGYRGFHLAFAPRVVARARALRMSAPGTEGLFNILLAPLFCMGFFNATRKRQLVSILVTSGIICLVLLVGMTPQPWRGIIDTGVVLGLLFGITSIVNFWLQAERGTWRHPIATDVPVEIRPDDHDKPVTSPGSQAGKS